MGPRGVTRQSHKQRIYDTLVDEIAAGRHEPGTQLPSVRAIARDLGTSLSPVYQALESLQAAGYIEKRGGSGTYVVDGSPELTLSRTVALGLSPRAHVWGELDMHLATELQRCGLNPLIVDFEEGSAGRRLESVARSEVRAVVVRAQGGRWPRERLRALAEEGKVILGVAEWGSATWPGLYRVLSDHESGGAQAAEHLWRAGHRHVLATAPRPAHLEPGDPARAGEAPRLQGGAFVDAWRRLGGRLTCLSPDAWEETLPRYHRDAVLATFDAEDPPTALFGTMDVLVAALRRLLRRHRPDVAGEVALVGYYDTPWSQTGDPPFTTVSLNLPELARRAAGVLSAALRGQGEAPGLSLLTPQLVVREAAHNENGT